MTGTHDLHGYYERGAEADRLLYRQHPQIRELVVEPHLLAIAWVP
jgi:hypothetical protein